VATVVSVVHGDEEKKENDGATEGIGEKLGFPGRRRAG
jgi:hypothetical protein